MVLKFRRDTERQRMATNETNKSAYTLIGDRVCVDLANTIYPQVKPGGSIATWGELVGFLRASRLVGKEQYQRLVDLEVSVPKAVAAAHRAALELRDAVREAVVAIAERRPVPGWCVEDVNRVLRFTEGYEQLLPDGEGWRLGYVEVEKRLEWLLAAIARSAAELIAEGPKAPVRKCGRPECILYFYDTSRTGKRRWCQMAVCGNRAKVAAFVRRKNKREHR